MINNVLCISDTHNRHKALENMPDADVIVHCGDFTEFGTEEEALDFMEWYCDLSYRYKIFTLGNHDTCLYGANIDGLDSNVFFLNDTGVEIEGVNFYGVPFFIEGLDCSPAVKIPDNTDILVTHQPPYGILDQAFEAGYGEIRYGSESLLIRVAEVRPRYCIFGHIHQMYGMRKEDGTVYVNSSLCAGNGTLNRPVLLDIRNNV